MPLIRDGRIVEDGWHRAADAAALAAAGGDVIVPLPLWREAAAALLARPGRLGVALANDEQPEALAGSLDRLSLVALTFPKFTDGRAYSQARLLRERLGFRGELRATGKVLSDQLAFMRRCGFDAFEIEDERALAGWTQAGQGFSAWYQPAGDGRTPIPRQRHRQGAPTAPSATAGPAPKPEACAAHWAY
jgi:uncharacterized protein (DUF934 family)